MNNDIQQWKPELYNDKHSFVYQYGMSLINLLDPKKNQRILDVGCGSGQLTYALSERVKEVIGIDSSNEMIEDARSKYPNIEFQVANASEVRFTQRFDAIFSNATLHWVKDYKRAIECMNQNLKIGGKIALEFGGKGNVQSIVQELKTSLKVRGYIEQSEMDLWYFPSIGEYATELESAGFEVLSAELFDRPTELADENSGIIDWLSMFAERYFAGVTQDQKEEIKKEVQENLKETCLIHGKWVADYKRIRILGVKVKEYLPTD